MSRLSELVVRVLDPASLASWYCRVLGMEAAEDPRSPGGWRLRYPGPGASLVLTRAEAGAAPYTPSRDSCYWKVRGGARPRCTVYSTVQYSTVYSLYTASVLSRWGCVCGTCGWRGTASWPPAPTPPCPSPSSSSRCAS